ncbi:MAG: pilus assembly protein [Thermoflexales bacterium]|nr:pilus assembly protein [Thermoflexales bacterium]
MDRQRYQKGQSLVEFALLLPLLIMILSGLLDLGRAYYVVVTLEDMAAEGAAYAALHPYDASGIWNRAAQASGGMITVSPDDVDVEYPPVMYVGAPITVTVRYSFRCITPFVGDFFPDGVIPLRGTATHAIISLQ